MRVSQLFTKYRLTAAEQQLAEVQALLAEARRLDSGKFSSKMDIQSLENEEAELLREVSGLKARASLRRQLV